MLAIDVRSDIKGATRYLNRVERKQIPFATAKALTKTAKAAQKEIRREMPRVLDRPKKFTLDSTFVKPARKTTLVARVGFKDLAVKGTPAGKYLLPQISGGRRRHKRFERALILAGVMRTNEYAVPGDDIRLNQYGNIPIGAITTMLSQLRASPDPGQNATGSSRSKRSRRGRAYFYRRGFRGVFVRTSRRAFTVFLKFVRLPRYRRRLRFPEIVQGTVRFRFPREFKLAMRQALRTAR
jgi:hypothetical protein